MSYVAPTGTSGVSGLFGVNLGTFFNHSGTPAGVSGVSGASSSVPSSVQTPFLSTPTLQMPVQMPAGAQGVGYETTLPSEQSVAYMFRWLLAWMVVLIVLWLLNKTSVGHVTIYYLLLLALVFLVVTQYKWFANALAPLTGTLIVPTPQATSPIPPASSAVGGINQG